MRYGGIFDFDAKSERLHVVNAELESGDVWNDPKHAQDLGREKKSLEAIVSTLSEIRQGLLEAQELFELAAEDEDDATLEAIDFTAFRELADFRTRRPVLSQWYEDFCTRPSMAQTGYSGQTHDQGQPPS